MDLATNPLSFSNQHHEKEFNSKGQRERYFSKNSSQTSDNQNQVVEVSPKLRYQRFNEIIFKDKFRTAYKAFDSESGIEVAWHDIQIKDLSKQEKEHINEEITIMRKLNHPNLIKLIQAWFKKEEQKVIIITEYYEQGLFKQYLKKVKQLKLRNLKSYFKMILQGICYFHSQEIPIIHRDIRCDNLFINSQKQIIIGGLGLAATCQNFRKSIIGTPEFMAPEVFEEHYDISADIYAFGMCMLEMVTGETPYSECQQFPTLVAKIKNRILPECFWKIKDEELKQFIKQCFLPPQQRPKAIDLLESE